MILDDFSGSNSPRYRRSPIALFLRLSFEGVVFGKDCGVSALLEHDLRFNEYVNIHVNLATITANSSPVRGRPKANDGSH